MKKEWHTAEDCTPFHAERVLSADHEVRWGCQNDQCWSSGPICKGTSYCLHKLCLAWGVGLIIPQFALWHVLQSQIIIRHIACRWLRLAAWARTTAWHDLCVCRHVRCSYWNWHSDLGTIQRRIRDAHYREMTLLRLSLALTFLISWWVICKTIIEAKLAVVYVFWALTLSLIALQSKLIVCCGHPQDVCSCL